MRATQRGDDVVVPLDRVDRLEPELRHALLAPGLPHARRGPLAAEERSRSLRVPRAALVSADAAGARLEERVPHDIERFGRDEDDELASQAQSSIWARCNLPE